MVGPYAKAKNLHFEPDVRVAVYDRHGQHKGDLAEVVYFDAQANVNSPDVVKVTYRYDDPLAKEIGTVNSTVAVWVDGDYFASGRLQEPVGVIGGSVEALHVGWMSYLDSVLAWPKPTGTLGDQEGTWKSGHIPIENAVKDVCRLNLDRMGVPFLTEAKSGRGVTRQLVGEMKPLSETCSLPTTGLSWTVVWVWSGARARWCPELRCVEPTDFGPVLKHDSGQREPVKFRYTAPAVSRVVVAGKEQRDPGVKRRFEQLVDVPRETAMGPFPMERFLVESGVDDVQQAMLDAAFPVLEQGRSKWQLQSQALGGSALMWERDYKLGRRKPIEVREGVVVSEVITSVRLQGRPGQGMTIEPTVGDRESTDIPRFKRLLADVYKV